MEGDAGRSERLEAARSLLRAEGIPAELSPAGADGEIAAIRGDLSLRERLARLAPEIRQLGFRYVALDLAGNDNEDEDS